MGFRLMSAENKRSHFTSFCRENPEALLRPTFSPEKGDETIAQGGAKRNPGVQENYERRALERATESLYELPDPAAFSAAPSGAGIASSVSQGCAALHPGLRSAVPSGLESAPGARCRVSRHKLTRFCHKTHPRRRSEHA